MNLAARISRALMLSIRERFTSPRVLAAPGLQPSHLPPARLFGEISHRGAEQRRHRLPKRELIADTCNKIRAKPIVFIYWNQKIYTEYAASKGVPFHSEAHIVKLLVTGI